MLSKRMILNFRSLQSNAEKISKNVTGECGLPFKGCERVEPFKFHWTNLYTFKENDDKGKAIW